MYRGVKSLCKLLTANKVPFDLEIAAFKRFLFSLRVLQYELKRSMN